MHYNCDTAAGDVLVYSTVLLIVTINGLKTSKGSLVYIYRARNLYAGLHISGISPFVEHKSIEMKRENKYSCTFFNQ